MSVKNMLEHQIETMVTDVNRLEITGGSDAAALARIRTTVSHELLTCDVMDIMSVVTKFAGLLVKLRDGHQIADYAQ